MSGYEVEQLQLNFLETIAMRGMRIEIADLPQLCSVPMCHNEGTQIVLFPQDRSLPVIVCNHCAKRFVEGMKASGRSIERVSII